MGKILVADEVWIATALLHLRNPDQKDFAVREIVRQAEAEEMAGPGPLRPGVQIHVYLHCVANKPPNPARYRMLIETSKGRRRLFRPGDSCHHLRTGKPAPNEKDIPKKYRKLLDWYYLDYVRDGGSEEVDPILSLRGMGKSIWNQEDADSYVSKLRAEWQ